MGTSTALTAVLLVLNDLEGVGGRDTGLVGVDDDDAGVAMPDVGGQTSVAVHSKCGRICEPPQPHNRPRKFSLFLGFAMEKFLFFAAR